MIELILLEKLKLGDELAFELIFKEHHSSLVRYASGLIGSASDAEDLVEDCFFWLWQEREVITIRKTLQAFLYTIVHNKCLNYMKRQKVCRNYEAYLKVYAIKMEINYPESILISNDLSGKINEGIDKLPKQCRLIFCLSRHEGKKYEEIAVMLKISINTVKKQMSRAIFKLRAELKDYL